MGTVTLGNIFLGGNISGNFGSLGNPQQQQLQNQSNWHNPYTITITGTSTAHLEKSPLVWLDKRVNEMRVRL